MSNQEDRELLRDYLEHHSEQAFAELVRRYVNLVYSTAFRLTEQSQMAEDVTQSVFIRLARKAASLKEANALPGWLYRTARHVSLSALRAENRRRTRETTAMQMIELQNNPLDAWKGIAPVLDEAMDCLDRREQNVIIWHFFEGRNLREVGAMLGVTDEAARKRVSRTLEKLWLLLAKEGVHVAPGLLAPVLLENTIRAAPSHLAADVTVASMQTAVKGSALLFLLKFIQIMKITKSTAIATSIIALILSLSLAVWWNSPSASPTPSAKLAEKQPKLSAAVEVPKLPAGELAVSTALPQQNPQSNSSLKIDPSPSAPAIAPDINQSPADMSRTGRQLYGKKLAKVLVDYMNSNNAQLPADPQAYLKSTGVLREEYQFDVLLAGFVPAVASPDNVILLVEHEAFMLDDGVVWGKTYVFADGHAETFVSSDGDFGPLERVSGIAPGSAIRTKPPEVSTEYR
jgi:RNA polymerase sigma factor (sigma-70 family)